jgi:hypothetical protein
LQDASTSARRAALLHEKSKEVTAWLSRRHLPEDLQEEVVNYYANTWITQAGTVHLKVLGLRVRDRWVGRKKGVQPPCKHLVIASRCSTLETTKMAVQ